MTAPHEDPSFYGGHAVLLYGDGPTVFVLYLTAGINAALLDKLGATPIFIMGGMLVLFTLVGSDCIASR